MEDFFFQAEDGIRDGTVTGVQTCALPISRRHTGGEDELAVVCETYAIADVGHLEILNQLDTPSYISNRKKRSEERRVGKECRSRWSTYHYKKRKEKTRRELERATRSTGIP